MKKTMLTCDTLDRFEKFINPETLTAEQVQEVEHLAYSSNSRRCSSSFKYRETVLARSLPILFFVDSSNGVLTHKLPSSIHSHRGFRGKS